MLLMAVSAMRRRKTGLGYPQGSEAENVAAFWGRNKKYAGFTGEEVTVDRIVSCQLPSLRELVRLTWFKDSILDLHSGRYKDASRQFTGLRYAVDRFVSCEILKILRSYLSILTRFSSTRSASNFTALRYAVIVVNIYRIVRNLGNF